MLERNLIGFETAKLAKEKNFNIPVNRAWSDKDNKVEEYEHYYFFNNDEKVKKHPRFPLYSAPTLQLLQEWLRKEHDIHVQVFINSWSDRTYVYRIHAPEHYIPSSGDYLLDDDKVIGEHDYVLEKGLQRAMELI